jgi:hypothetical protein
VEGVTDDDLICNVGANSVSGVAGVDDTVVESDVDAGNTCGNVFVDVNYVVGCAKVKLWVTMMFHLLRMFQWMPDLQEKTVVRMQQIM